MISNQILQNTIDGLKGITRIDLCIIDVEGKILAATFPDAEKYVEPAQAFVESPADSQVVNGYQFFKVFDEHQLEYILLANGDSDDVYIRDRSGEWYLSLRRTARKMAMNWKRSEESSVANPRILSLRLMRRTSSW